MKLRSVSIRLVAGASVALGLFLGGALLSAAPANAQESPWYMPPAWVHPAQTGPKIRKLPGYYGHNAMYRAGTYGSYSNGCYGRCAPRLPGLITTGYGVVLQRPAVAIFDPNAYQLVAVAQNPYYQSMYQAAPPEPATGDHAAKAIRPLVVPVGIDSRPGQEPQAKVSTQHGVRIIRPASTVAY